MQLAHFRMGQPGRGLIHQDNLGIQRQSLEDLHLFLLHRRQRRYLRIQIQIDIVLLEQRLCSFTLFESINETDLGSGRTAKENIIQNRQRRNQIGMLVDTSDPQFQHRQRAP